MENLNDKMVAERNPPTRGYKERFDRLVTDVDKHEIFVIAGSIAYTTALALAPFILILLSFSAFLGPEMQQKIYLQMSSAVGDKAGATVKSIVENAGEHPTASGFSGIIGFLVLAVSASAIFSQLRIALNKINEHKYSDANSGFRGFVKDKFLSVGLVFGFAFLSIVSLVASTVIAVLYEGGEGWLLHTLSFVVNFVLFSILFGAIYRFIPSDTLSWRRCLISGSVSSIFFLLGKTLIGVYLGKAGLESSYGAAGSLIVFLAWVYYTALTLLVSYEVTNHLVLSEDENWGKKLKTTKPLTH